MQGYDVCCPACGHINQHVYLEETDGFMECEKCGMVTRAGTGAESEAGFLVRTLASCPGTAVARRANESSI